MTSADCESLSDSGPSTGLIVAAVIVIAAWLSVWLIGQLPEPWGNLPISIMLIAILAGLALAPIATTRPHWQPGLELARKPILRVAVALIGLRLSLVEAGLLGWQALPLVLGAIGLGLATVLILARLTGTPGRLAALLAVGTAICGASAIAAAAPGLRARSEEICYAIACVALIGLAATLFYPALLQTVLEDSTLVGLALGAAVHDTAQVTAAAVFHEQTWHAESTVTAATVSKLLRNLGMLIVIPIIVWSFTRTEGPGRSMPPLPLFIVGFLALSGVRTLVDHWLGPDHLTWQTIIEWAGHLSLFGFTMAMAALAMNIRFRDFRALGWKPALIAVIAAAVMLGWSLFWLGN
ncbi:MAG: YeiH family protein [Wenzhouxiangella sp.]